MLLHTIIFHEVIAKRSAALDQLREGMRDLGVLDAISENPEIFLPLFVYSEENISFINVKGIIKFDASCSADTADHVIRCLTSMTKDSLENFVVFCTGSKFLPNQPITIKSAEGEGIFASTCLYEVIIPTQIETFEILSRELINAIDPVHSKSFTVV